VLAWPLGALEQEFSGAAVYDYASNLCFAPVRPRAAAAGGKSGSSVLAWSADATGGSITQLGHAIHLPALHALFPVSHTPEGEDEEEAAAAAEQSQADVGGAAQQVDGSGQALPGAVAVLASGAVMLCSGSEVLAESEEREDQQAVAASCQAGVLVVVTAEQKAGGAAFATVYKVQVCCFLAGC
jgi:hypothetical protein